MRTLVILFFIFLFTVSVNAGVVSKTYFENNIVTKVDKKIPTNAGNIATLDASGNLIDGGAKVSDINAKVSKTGAESIDGVKTFTSIPLIPTATLPTK